MSNKPITNSEAHLLEERYGNPIPALNALNDTIATILSHRSIRSYSKRQLPSNTLDVLCAAAQSASTSSNLQTWSVIAIRDPERKSTLADLAGKQEHIRTCPLFLVWLADLTRLRTMGVNRRVAHGSLDYLESFIVATIDATLAAQNTAIAAESLNMGIVYIGGMRNHPEEVARILSLPSETFAVFGMCIGYPNDLESTAVKPRLPPMAVLHHESYDVSKLEVAVKTYNATMDKFYRKHGMKTHGSWDVHSLNRVRGVDAMNGRDRLTEALKNLGFLLR